MLDEVDDDEALAALAGEEEAPPEEPLPDETELPPEGLPPVRVLPVKPSSDVLPASSPVAEAVSAAPPPASLLGPILSTVSAANARSPPKNSSRHGIRVRLAIPKTASRGTEDPLAGPFRVVRGAQWVPPDSGWACVASGSH